MLALIGAWALVCLPFLGSGGLFATEGHRAISGWEMLDTLREEGRASREATSAILVPRLFGVPYLRKPPGISWATALSAAAFGQSEFSARLPSALAMLGMTLSAWWFARRWFSNRWALAAGMAQLLMPWLWPIARGAEIESLNLLGAQLASLAAVDLCRRERAGRVLVIVLGACGITLMGAMKGPAGAPALVAALLAACVVGRTFRPLANARVWAMTACGCLPLALLGWGVAREAARLPNVVTQSVGEFLWSLDRVVGVLALGPVALASMLPFSLALLFPWGGDARREAGSGLPESAVTTARTLAWACVLTLTIFALSGVSNPRYAMPASVFVAPLVAYVMLGAASGFTVLRARIARGLMLGHPAAWAAAMFAALVADLAWFEPGRRATSGREAGFALATSLPDGAVVVADHLVEARPETLLYAVRRAREQGSRVVVRWDPGLISLGVLPEGTIVVLRTDGASDELARVERIGLAPRLEAVASGTVHKFTFTAFRVTDEAARQAR
ncbi:MAG: glycosyltransferase family 39 protein [Phycisphaeraceae bacterium]|nr:glycosyltransferase family 39 protein [Phycisphaeraceae bacterium]